MSSVFFSKHLMPEDPPTELARLQILSSTSGLRVSPLVLGAGSIGDKWNDFWGVQTRERAIAVLDKYYEAGGNFIDTASYYQDGQSEIWLGEWMEARKNRNHLVIATKYTGDYLLDDVEDPKGTPRAELKGRTANAGGNHRRALHTSVQSSLRRLRTDFIDILYVHWWDYTTSIEEVMDSLHLLVQRGQVLYLGISDTPAWIVAAANTYARAHGKTPFSIYQGRWSIVDRGMERDVIPMARHFGMAVAPWGVLGGGVLQSKKATEQRAKDGESFRPAMGGKRDNEMSDALEKVAEELGVPGDVTGVALAYMRSKAASLGVYNIFPVVGLRKVEQVDGNIKALELRLSEEQIKALEAVRPFDAGWPTNFIGEDPNVSGEVSVMQKAGVWLRFPGAVRSLGK